MRSDSSGNVSGLAGSRFHEEQLVQPSKRRWVVALPPATLTALAAGQLRLGHPLFSHAPSTAGLMALAVLLWAVYVWLSRVRLVTDVDDAAITMRLRGLSREHRIPRSKIRSVSLLSFNPDKDFGGYGIRSVKGGQAYVGLTGRGVRAELDGGGFAVIGSSKADALFAALK